MDTEGMLEELKKAYESINKISNAIATPEGITHHAQYDYLKDKMATFCMTADHVLSQLKNKAREQRIISKRNRT